jgi:hypothetical protein
LITLRVIYFGVGRVGLLFQKKRKEKKKTLRVV